MSVDMRRTARPSVLIGLAALMVAPLPAGPAAAAPAAASGCADVEVIAVRGTREPGTVGTLRAVADRVVAGTDRTVRLHGLPYPASWNASDSAVEGVDMLGARVNAQARACPGERFVLLGYSQGAWVVGDALIGGFTLDGRSEPTISPEAGRRVAAIVLYGDPRFRPGEPFDHGTFSPSREGNFPRPPGAYGTYTDRMRSYCDATDQTCQNVIGLGHLGYWPRYDEDAAAFVLERLRSTPLAAPAAPGGAAEDSPVGSVADGLRSLARNLGEQFGAGFSRLADWLDPFG